MEPNQYGQDPQPFSEEQKKNERVAEIIKFLEKGKLPYEESRACLIALQQSLFAIVDGTLYFIDAKRQNRKRAVVPTHLQEQLLAEAHRSIMGGHFSGKRVYETLTVHWWWDGVYRDALQYVQNVPYFLVVVEHAILLFIRYHAPDHGD